MSRKNDDLGRVDDPEANDALNPHDGIHEDAGDDSPVTLPDEEVQVEDSPADEDEHHDEPIADSDESASSSLAHSKYPAIDTIGPDDGDAEAVLALKNLEERRRTRKRGRIIRGAIAAAIVVAAIGAWVVANAPKNDEPVTVPKVAAAMREDLTESVNTNGSLKAASVVAVTPEISGIIESVQVEEGQEVEEGQTLLTIRSKDVEKALNTAQRGVDKAQRGVDSAYSNVDKAQERLNSARDKYDEEVDAYNNSIDEAEEAAQDAYDETYDKAIAEIPKTATKEERQELKEKAEEAADLAYETTYNEIKLPDPGDFDESAYVEAIDAAESSVTDAQDSLAEAQETYGEAEEEAGHRTVTAPASGVVLQLSAVEGASVGGASGGTSTATSETLAQIADVSKLKVAIEVNEIDVANITAGQKAKVTFSSFPDIEMDAEVTSVASVATGSSSGNSESGSGGGGGVVTFAVEATIDKPDSRLKPGMSANVEIITKEVPNVITVPVAALLEEADGTYVEVVAGEDEESVANPEKRKITVGETTKTDVEVKKGLSEGELVLAGTTTLSGAGDSEGQGDADDSL